MISPTPTRSEAAWAGAFYAFVAAALVLAILRAPGLWPPRVLTDEDPAAITPR